MALLLQFFGGSGYLYVGRPKRFFVQLGVTILGLSALNILVVPSYLDARITLPLLFAIFLIVALFFIVDCIRIAVTSSPYTLRAYNRWWVYLIVAIATTLGSISYDVVLGPSKNVRSFYAPSGSMSPSLISGDYFFVNACGFDCIEAKRGDIAVFKLPRNETIDYVKRIIGLPGDTIQMKDGVLFLNGSAVKRTRLPEPYINSGSRGNKSAIDQYEEKLPNGRRYLTLDLTSRSILDNTNEYRVPEGHYFVMGDNRDNSLDSRVLAEIGYIPAKNIYAKPLFIFWSDDLERIGMKLD
ncbi:signal peptidase I [Pseudovibrio axinellae]|uniref:signal peptidase I n=1 Tax=Pseudovibrio axinellae TaxID=989403 RepID=UPI000834AD06